MGPLALGLAGALSLACVDRSPEITRPHRIRQGVEAPSTNASESERFGMRPAQPAQKQPTPDEFFDWTTPEGWVAQPPNQYRMVNMKVGNVECFLSNVSPGATELNINRWRGQMGASPLEPVGIASLKTAELLGRPAYRMDVSGSYTGMTGEEVTDARMLTLIADFPQFAMTVKMIGPRAEVEAQTANFELFTSSLAFSEELAARLRAGEAGASDDPHAGHDHAPGEGHGEPPADDPHAGHDHAPGEGHGAPAADQMPKAEGGRLAWDAPSGWAETAPKPQRHVTFNMSARPGVECYVTLLPGMAGGLLGNLNRWLGQVGLPQLDNAGVAALPRISLLGKQAHLLEAIGAERAIIASLIERPGEVMFIKMTGPPEDVSAERDNFITFCASLRNE